MLTSAADVLVICPVEPVHLPEEITRYLEIAFPPVVIRPAARKRIYLTFPVEIGVFLDTGQGFSQLDLFSLAPAKFSLYGTPAAGLVTRWHESRLYEDIPAPDPLREGVMELELNNVSSGAVEVRRAVFESSAMCIHYGTIAAMKAELEIISTHLAETFISSRPSCGCTERAIARFAARKVPMVQQKGFFMEFGTA